MGVLPSSWFLKSLWREKEIVRMGIPHADPSPPPLLRCWYLAHVGHMQGPFPDTPCVQVPGTDDSGSPDRKCLWDAKGRLREVSDVDTANHFANNVKGALGISLGQERDEDAEAQESSHLPTQGTASQRSPSWGEELTTPRPTLPQPYLSSI